MKKILTVLTTGVALFATSNAYACGEINDLTSSVGTVTKTNPTNYVVSIPEGTSTVELKASTDYDWVTGYEPRTVSTNNKVELKVDGNKCGYGIYTYFVSFKKVSNAIAENTTTENANNTENNTSTETNENANQTTTENNTETTSNEPALKLSSLTIDGYKLEFLNTKTKYELDVESDVTSLDITAVPEDAANTVNISSNAKALKEGENTITITVVNSEGTSSIYEIVVTKAKALSSNNYLSSISVENYALNFDTSVDTYSLEIGKESSLNISVITESELATYEILNNSNLQDGSKITIRVTAEDGSTKDYVINVSRKFDIMDYIIYIVIAGLILLLVVLLLIRKNRKKKVEPEIIESEAVTAGTVNTTSNTSDQTPAQSAVQTAAPSTEDIEIIEPTNIEGDAKPKEEAQANQASTPSDSPTEVFKL